MEEIKSNNKMNWTKRVCSQLIASSRRINQNKKMPLEKMRDFYYMMQFYMASKIPLTESILLVEEDLAIGSFDALIHSLRNGQPFYKVLKENGLTDPFIDSCLLIGETTGSYINAFANIKEYLDQKIMDRKYFIQISAYPLIVLMLIMGVGSFVIFIISPQLHKTISNLRIDPPTSLVILNNMNAFLRSSTWWIFCAITVVFMVSVSKMTKNTFGKRIQKWFMNLKIVDKYYRLVVIRRIFWQLHILFSSGVSLVDAFRIIGDSNHSFGYREILFRIGDSIQGGKSFSTSLEDYGELFPRAVILYIKLGEKTNSLDINLCNASTYLNIKAKDRTDGIKRTLQPALIVICGILVSLLLAIVVPIINAATSIGGI